MQNDFDFDFGKKIILQMIWFWNDFDFTYKIKITLLKKFMYENFLWIFIIWRCCIEVLRKNISITSWCDLLIILQVLVPIILIYEKTMTATIDSCGFQCKFYSLLTFPLYMLWWSNVFASSWLDKIKYDWMWLHKRK